MRVAFITSSFPPYTSGVGVNAATITSGLVDKGHEVGVFLPNYPENHTRKSPLVHPRVKLFHLSSFTNPFKPSHLLLAPFPASLIRLLTAFNPDIVHLQEPQFFLFAPVKNFTSLHHIPLVCAHHFPPQFVTNQLPRPFRLSVFNTRIVRSVVRLYNQSNHVITPTFAMEKLLRDHGLKTPDTVISNGVDTDRFAPIPRSAPHPPVVLYLGRLDFDKNLDTLVRAARDIPPPSEIWFAGGGKAVDFLKNLSASQGVATRIKFLGYIPESDKPATYNQATLFVMPSTAEAQSIVSLEAAASGLPLVLANAAALPELIDSRHPNGLLFRPQNPSDLASKINQLLSNHQLTEFGRNSRRLALGHDIKHIVEQYAQTYTSVRAVI